MEEMVMMHNFFSSCLHLNLKIMRIINKILLGRRHLETVVNSYSQNYSGCGGLGEWERVY